MPAPPCSPQTAALGAALLVVCAGLAAPPAHAIGRPAQALLMLRRWFAGRSDVRLRFTLAPKGPVWSIREIRGPK